MHKSSHGSKSHPELTLLLQIASKDVFGSAGLFPQSISVHASTIKSIILFKPFHFNSDSPLNLCPCIKCQLYSHSTTAWLL